MRITIICEDKHIEQVREKAKELTKTHLALTTPLSATGKEPATHWMCVTYMTDEGLSKLMQLKKHSIISNSLPKLILEELSLKLIK